MPKTSIDRHLDSTNRACWAQSAEAWPTDFGKFIAAKPRNGGKVLHTLNITAE
jgi:hypothetical protein